MRNVNVSFRKTGEYFIFFNTDYEDTSLRVYNSLESSLEDVNNWIVNGILPDAEGRE
jgi:hypothetical protein